MKLNDWKDYKPYRETVAKITELKRKVDAIDERVAEAKIKNDEALEKLYNVESLMLIDRATKEEYNRAKAVYDSTVFDKPAELPKLRRALALLECELPDLEKKAKEEYCEQFHPGYKSAVKRLADALTVVKEANDEVSRLFNEAEEIAPTERSTRVHGRKRPEGFPEALGLSDLSIKELLTKGINPVSGVWDDSLYESWTKKANEYLRS